MINLIRNRPKLLNLVSYFLFKIVRIRKGTWEQKGIFTLYKNKENKTHRLSKFPSFLSQLTQQNFCYMGIALISLQFPSYH